MVTGAFCSSFFTVRFKLSLTGLAVVLLSLPVQVLIQINANSKLVYKKNDFGAILIESEVMVKNEK